MPWRRTCGLLLGLQIIFFIALIPLLGWYLRPLLQWCRLLRFLGPIPQVAAGSVRVRSAFTAALVPALVAGVGSVNAMRPRLVEDRRVLERSGAAPRLWLSVSMWALVFGIRWSHYVAFHRSRENANRSRSGSTPYASISASSQPGP